MTNRIQIEKLGNAIPEEHSDEEIKSLIEKSEIRLDFPINKDVALLETYGDINSEYISIFTKGNFSAIKGKQKSRKTFASSLLLSAICYKSPLDDILFSKSNGNVLYFDTEQSEYFTFKTLERIPNIRGYTAQPTNLFCMNLREFEPKIRTKIIEYCIYNIPDISYVLIDGIRDLVYDINSQEEAVKISTKLLRWSKDKNCHITVVIHENKADASARGHLGTEIQNKCETVLSVTKEGSKSIIKPEITRGRDFKDITFEVINNGICFIPKIIDDYYDLKPDNSF